MPLWFGPNWKEEKSLNRFLTGTMLKSQKNWDEDGNHFQVSFLKLFFKCNQLNYYWLHTLLGLYFRLLRLWISVLSFIYPTFNGSRQSFSELIIDKT